MTLQTKLITVVFAALAGGGVLCPLCRGGVQIVRAQATAVGQAADTATVRFQISKMTCGSCAVTARLALERITGVLKATVSLDDSLGVVRYDPSKVTPSEIAAQLTRQTGYGARVLPEARSHNRRGGE